MKNWDAIEWSIVILASTIPITIIMLILARILTGESLPGESAELTVELLMFLGGGVIGILGTSYSNKNKTK